jgi:uridine kinase
VAYRLGIAGGTGAGKTTIARAVVEALDGATLVDLDSYYLDRRDLLPADRRRLNFDEPGAIDVGLLVAHLDRLARGEPIAKPVYSFATHRRVGTVVVAPEPVVVVEGLFALWWAEVRSRLDLKVFVDAPADLRLARRIRRDVLERGRSVEDVLEQYLATVRPMHDRYVEPARAHADLVIAGDGPVAEAVQHIVGRLHPVIPRGDGGANPAGVEESQAAPGVMGERR